MKFFTFVVVLSMCIGVTLGKPEKEEKCTKGWNTKVCRERGYTKYNGGDTVCDGKCTEDQCCSGLSTSNFPEGMRRMLKADKEKKCTKGWNTKVCRERGYTKYNGGDTVCDGECTEDQCCSGLSTSNFPEGMRRMLKAEKKERCRKGWSTKCRELGYTKCFTKKFCDGKCTEDQCCSGLSTSNFPGGMLRG